MHSSDLKLLETLLIEKGGVDGKSFSESEIHRFLLYYELVLKWNSRLHLTTLIDPFQFFQRHLLESSFAESLLIPEATQIWDLGSGLGVPGIPVGILRPDIAVSLVEVKLNKVIFLGEAVSMLSMINTKICHRRIESLTELSAGDCIMARAVEKMEEMVPIIIRLGHACSQILFFGSESLGKNIKPHLVSDTQMVAHHLPATNNQYIFSIIRST